MLTRFDQPLQVELRFSRQLAGASAVLHALAAIGCLLVPLHRGWQLTIIVMLGGHFAWFLRRQVTATVGKAIGAIAWDSERGWRLRGASGAWSAARLVLPVLVTARLVIMRLRTPDLGIHSAVIVADRLDADEFRRLRARLLQSAQKDG